MPVAQPTPRRSAPGAGAPADTRRRVAAERATAIVRVDSDLAARAVAARALRVEPRGDAVSEPRTIAGGRARSRATIDWPVAPLGPGRDETPEAPVALGVRSRIRGWFGRAR